MQARVEPFLALIVVISVVAFWCGILYFISFLTGWHALTRRFRAEAVPYGDIKSAGPLFYTIYMRYWEHYSSAVRLTAAADALYASILLPFRIGHPPLRIPWNEIQFGRAQRFMFRYVELKLGNEEKIPVRISLRMARNLGILDRYPSS